MSYGAPSGSAQAACGNMPATERMGSLTGGHSARRDTVVELLANAGVAKMDVAVEFAAVTPWRPSARSSSISSVFGAFFRGFVKPNLDMFAHLCPFSSKQ